jgi:hypothetical protein
VVVHQDEDDLGKGGQQLSLTTGNAGARYAVECIAAVKIVHLFMPLRIQNYYHHIAYFSASSHEDSEFYDYLSLYSPSCSDDHGSVGCGIIARSAGLFQNTKKVFMIWTACCFVCMSVCLIVWFNG